MVDSDDDEEMGGGGGSFKETSSVYQINKLLSQD